MNNKQAIAPLLKVGLSIRSELEAISRPVERIMQLLRRANCVDGSEHEVEAALREAVNNAVIHGNQLDASKRVHIRCCCEPGSGAVFVVADEGRGFDSEHLPDPSDADHRLNERGRGIFLIKHFMDEVRFEKGGTEVHMRKGSLHIVPAFRPGRSTATPSLSLQKAS